MLHSLPPTSFWEKQQRTVVLMPIPRPHASCFIQSLRIAMFLPFGGPQTLKVHNYVGLR